MTTSQDFLFISHISEDRDAAMAVVEELERRGLRCWIAPRDVRPGHPFDDEIADAIESSRAMLLIFSEGCNDSEYIRREVTVAGESHKVVIPFRIENAEPKHGLRVRLSDLHWLDAYASREQAIDELLKTLPANKPDQQPAAPAGESSLRTDERGAKGRDRSASTDLHKRTTPPPPKFGIWPWAAAAVVCLVLIAGGIIAYPRLSDWIKSSTPTPVAVAKTPTATLTPTSTPLHASTPPPSPQFDAAACNPQTASFYDDFHKLDAGWGLSADGLARYADNEMVITPAANTSYSARYRSLLYQNATICARIRAPTQFQDPTNTRGGVMFWESPYGNYYVSEITAAGTYAIYRHRAGVWIVVVPRTADDHIRREPGAVNEIRLELVDSTATLFINGAKIRQIRAQPAAGGGSIGLYAESETTVVNEWRFADIAVVDHGRATPPVLPPSPSGPHVAPCQPNNSTDFQDTFAPPDPAWGFAGNPMFQIADGQVAVTPKPNTSHTQLYWPLTYKNAVICATVRSPPDVGDVGGSTNGGLVFWAIDIQNLYAADVFPNGTFQVTRLVNNAWINVVPRTPFERLNKGVGAMNLLQAVIEGTNGSLYLNGAKAVDFRGQPPPDGGMTGLLAESEANRADAWTFLGMAVVATQVTTQ